MFNHYTTYKMSSGMGGTFDVKYVGTDGALLLFQVKNKGWEKVVVSLTPDRAAQEVHNGN